MIPAEHLLAEVRLTPTERDNCIATLIRQNILSNQQLHEQIRKIKPTLKLPPWVEVVNGLLWYNERIYVPDKEIHKSVLLLYHDSPLAGHLG